MDNVPGGSGKVLTVAREELLAAGFIEHLRELGETRQEKERITRPTPATYTMERHH